MGLMGQDAPAGRLFSPADLKALVAAGHELGCHTFSHSHAWDTPSRVFEESLLENQRALSNLLPGEVFRTMSYPIGCPRPETKRATAKHFACCRGGGQRFNVGSIDLNYLSAYFLEQDVDGVGSVWSVLDRSCREAGWLILATHDVCDQPSPFGCTPEFFEEVVRYTVRSGAIILPVGQAWELIRKGHGC
jgi:peptidoglycan/xylan/chitin deacetylase (PgdA/CDA1 family)